eukprot:TRINITY_DN16755_c0_g1_i1.p1 TRINITY_DN16755_c0_g1~~TRINITY_DN16755_c0_g1_i1.p1  ORF type:complete len:581 (+),score=190.11 TRINITY_DN16755_c0_g1_i1:42-1784(+)
MAGHARPPAIVAPDSDSDSGPLFPQRNDGHAPIKPALRQQAYAFTQVETPRVGGGRPPPDDAASAITEEECELSWKQYNKRSLLVSLMVALSAVPVFTAPLITDLSLQTTHEVGGLAFSLYKLIAFILIACAMLALFAAPLIFPCLSDTAIGVLMVSLALAANVVVAADRESIATALVSAGLSGFSLGFLWLTPGVCVDNLLRAFPEGSLGLAAGTLHFFIHLFLLPAIAVESMPEPTEWLAMVGMAACCGALGLVLHATRPYWDGGTGYLMGKGGHSTPIFELWSDLGSVNLLFFTLFFEGVAWYEAWVDLPYEIMHTGDVAKDESVFRSLSYVMPITIAANALTSLIFGFAANFVAPKWGMAGGTALLIAGRVMKYVYHPHETADIYVATALLFAFGLAGVNIQLFCFLQRLIQQFNASPVTVYVMWGATSALGFLVSAVGAGRLERTSSFAVYCALGVAAFLSVLAASYNMSGGRGWHGLIPATSNLRLDGMQSVCSSQALQSAPGIGSPPKIPAAKNLLRTSVSQWSASPSYLAAGPGFAAQQIDTNPPRESTPLWSMFAALSPTPAPKRAHQPSA